MMKKTPPETPGHLGILSRFSLEDRVAIVTGAGSGIGKGIAVALAQAGARIVSADINVPAGEATAKEVLALGREALPVAVNVLDTEQVNSLVAEAMTKFGRIDILVNNVGATQSTSRVPFLELQEKTWDMIVDLNLKSTFLCSQAVARVMTERKTGNIINIASGSALQPYPGQPPYGAAKAAVIHYTETLAVLLAPCNIRVNCIAPGRIRSPGTTYLNYLGDSDERAKEAGTPLGRAGSPEDIGLAAIYLASQAAAYITGITLHVGGGPLMGGKMLQWAEKQWKGKQ